MATSRPTCLFCGANPDSTNDAGQVVCYRHVNSYDMTSGSTKRKADEETGYEHDDFYVPHLTTSTKKGKKRAKVAVVPQKECIVCMSKFRTAGVTCSEGSHSTCKSCTRMYIEKTLGSKGTVYFDRVACVDNDCWGMIAAKDAEGVLTKKKLAEMHKMEWDTVYNIAGEVDPSSLALMNDKTKLCPSCKVPIEKNKGCDHISCRCGHDFWWTCGGIGGTCTNYPFHEEGCSKEYTAARVVNA